MKNWSQYLEYYPSHIAYPESETEIQAVIQKAILEKQSVRMIGSGHSFSPICVTDQVLISLDKYQGLISVNKEKHQATIKAGTKLYTLGDLLFEQGMAMENLGDIDVQSLAGTISTGTHGTGITMGTISTQVVALKFVNGLGEIVSCSPTNKPELFQTAQVSLGTLGVIVEITLQCVPAYRLQLKNDVASYKEVMDTIAQRNKENRNFEFYWMPHTDVMLTKTSNIVHDEPDDVGWFNTFSEYVVENYGFMAFCEFANWFPKRTASAARIAAATISPTSKVSASHKVYATKRLLKFHEMEYNIPIEAHESVLNEVKRIFEKHKLEIIVPLENRFVKGDNMTMSPAYGRDSAYIAFHTYYKKDPKPYFKIMEEICRAHDGRPHWGKMNTLTVKDVEEIYPKFNVFLKHRQEQDPNKVFVSPYFETLFGL